MKATEECYSCLGRLVRQAAELVTEEPKLRIKAVEEGQKLLDGEFSIAKTPIAVATLLHRLVRAVTGNIDPYRRIKQAEVVMANDLFRHWKANREKDLRSCLVFAVRGNAIDFFKDLMTIEEDLARPVEFAIDKTMALEQALKCRFSYVF